MTGDSIDLRELRSLDECRRVVAIQEEVWGRDGEIVPASVLLVSAKRGGILLGAVDAGVIVGFVWSMPGLRDDGRRTHWSHMLGVVPSHRDRRLGERLKWTQRDRALQQGAELIEWTFDPLIAANAHFNLHVLGGVGASYGVNIYGELTGQLHRGTPTDRLIIEWRIREPHVARRHEARHAGNSAALLQPRSAEVLDAQPVIETGTRDGWTVVTRTAFVSGARRLLVPVPPRFLEMQQQATALALEWRFAVRDVMSGALAQGYQAVDFFIDRERGNGAYLLAL